ncbi:hypothetical protein ACFYNL_17660 [Streptomyces sp. NPDC007808]|uniref:hypothetical protein n=1 Tax=Streptomyces sp. NPDC007808 TaxID=3364779 RepID=UPI0036926488
MLERTSTTERYTRGVAAAVVAVVTLVLAANAGPARATEARPAEARPAEGRPAWQTAATTNPAAPADR